MESNSQPNSQIKRSTIGTLAKLMRTANSSGGSRTGHVLYKNSKIKLIKYDETNPSLLSSTAEQPGTSSGKVTEHLTELYEDQALCDLTLVARGEKLCTHKVVLSSFSDKYMKLFNEPGSEAITEIILPDKVSPEAAQDVVNYLYQGKLELNERNVEDVLRISVHLGIDRLIETCEEKMIACQPERIMHFVVLCKQLQLEHSLRRMIELAAGHFDTAVESSEYLQAEADDVVALFMASEVDDDTKYMAALEWLKAAPDRAQFASAILKTVQLQKVDPRRIQLIDENQQVADVADVKEMLLEAYRSHTFSFLKRTHDNNLETRLRIPSTSAWKKPVLAVVGGHSMADDDDGNTFFKLEIHDKFPRWDPLPNLIAARSFHCAVFAEDNIYVLGGCEKPLDRPSLSDPSSDVYRYHIGVGEWNKVAAMTEKRMMFAAVHLAGHIYVFGGVGADANALQSAERYDVRNNAWSSLPPLPLPCVGPATCVHNGTVFVIGGYTPSPNRILAMSTVFYLDLENNRWESKNPVPFKTFFASAASIDGTLYVLGGAVILDGDKEPTSRTDVCKYSDEDDEWQTVGSLKSPRHSAGAFCVGSVIYLVGGLNYGQLSPVSTVEAFDVATNQKSTVSDFNLPYPRLGSASCLVR